MACSMWRLLNNPTASKLGKNINITVRHGHHIRGKPPGVARTIKQRLEELNQKDPELAYRVDISLAPVVTNTKEQINERLKVFKEQKKNPQLEKDSRNRNLIIDLKETRAEWYKTCGPSHIKEIADHYGIFEHLYGDAYFYSRVPLHVHFTDANVKHPVFFGNVIKPSNATSAPEVVYESDEKALWSLVLTNLDGHFTESDKEYVHWFVGNIPGNKVEKGEVLQEYLQPFPAKGTGYHRFAFVLYKQDKKLDLSEYKNTQNAFDLSARTFKTLDFYRKHQDSLTPAGLSFFQSDWDKSLTNFYHSKLEMKEPIFEYDFDPPYIRPQEWFALRKPFNLYMDKYRDPKKINEEFLLRKLQKAHPFKAPDAPLPFPNAVKFEGYVPSWLKLEKRKSRLRWGRINDIE